MSTSIYTPILPDDELITVNESGLAHVEIPSITAAGLDSMERRAWKLISRGPRKSLRHAKEILELTGFIRSELGR